MSFNSSYKIQHVIFISKHSKYNCLHQLDTGVWVLLNLVVALISLAYFFLGKMMCGYVATKLCLGYSEV